MIQAKFGLNWPSGFRGEDFLISLQTDAGRQVMAIAHMTLWVRWAKNEFTGHLYIIWKASFKPCFL